jgi:hypothetical protein
LEIAVAAGRVGSLTIEEFFNGLSIRWRDVYVIFTEPAGQWPLAVSCLILIVLWLLAGLIVRGSWRELRQAPVNILEAEGFWVDLWDHPLTAIAAGTISLALGIIYFSFSQLDIPSWLGLFFVLISFTFFRHVPVQRQWRINRLVYRGLMDSFRRQMEDSKRENQDVSAADDN